MKRLVALLVVTALLSTACTSGARDPPGDPSGLPNSGGTLRILVVGDGPPVAFWDPLWPVWEEPAALHRCCLLRRLYSYTGTPGDEGGALARPDLAVRMPDVSDDGLTWTIEMQRGLRYAPPFEDREIVAGDVVAALERTARARTFFSSYYSVITGFDAYAAEDAASIAGLETPDDHTLVARLDEPAGDLPDRFGLTAAAPFPPRAVVGHRVGVIRYLVASGPYMIEGSGDLDPTLPPREQPSVAGFTNRRVTLVRNPSWDPSTDALRPAYPDRIEVLVESRPFDEPVTLRVERRIEARALRLFLAGDLALISEPSPALVRSVGSGEVQGRVVTERSSQMMYVPLNLALPPFDDVHVRRAVNLAFDREAFVRRGLRTQTFSVSASWHLVPAALEAGRIEDSWRPGWAAGVPDGGDLDLARREMARSRYDRDGDGRCDGEACSLLVPVQPLQPTSASRPLLRDALRAVGIAVTTAPLPEADFWWSVGQPGHRIPMVVDDAWVADHPNPSSFVVPLLYGQSLRPRSNLNASLLGATPVQLRRWGYAATSVPSVDARIERCLALTGEAQARCWAELDAYVMEAIAPVVPIGTLDPTWLLSPRVTSFSVDQSTGLPSYDRIVLAPEAGGTS